MAAFFVTGSGTDIGKTWAACALLRHWRQAGLEPQAIKPVATGYDPARPQDSDGAALLRALGRPAEAADVEAITPFRFRAPLSPDQAARREGGSLSARGVATPCLAVTTAARGPVLVEGAGGVMTPLNESETMLDLAVALDLPVIFVCGSYLGAISHTLTGLSVLAARGVRPPLVLVNETPDSTVDLHETAATLASHAPQAAILPIARGADGRVWAQASRLLGVEA
jgi:dethiobiotin synthetase